MLKMKRRIALVAYCLLVIAIPTAAQSRRPQPPGSAQLRSGFLAAFGSDFDLVKDEFKSRSRESGGGEFWLAHVKPIHTGYFGLQYRYRYNDKLYSHVEHEILFSVGPRGCRRGPPASGVYGRFCLGDTVIVAIVANDFTGHEFKLARNQPLKDEKDWQTFDEKYPASRDQELDETPVPNPSESLRYVGRRSHRMFHRSPGYTLRLLAEFEAVRPGKFNLHAAASAETLKSGETPAGGIPIIVVARDTPVTLIAGREEVRAYTMRANEEYLSSTSGNSYMTNVIILQPGDRLSVLYFSVARGRRDERGMNARLDRSDPAETLKPVISVHPFSVTRAYDFSDWLVDYLP